jgi:dihydroxyacetone kinase
MVRGFRAAVDAIAGYTGTARRSFTQAGTGFQNAAGGASGALVGGWLIAIGGALPTDDDAVDAAAMARAIAAATETLQRMGGAQAGDKTMLDTLIPFSKALATAAQDNASLPAAWAAAIPAAAAGMLSTVDMISRKGRASRLGERSRGTQDAGATSIYYVLQAFGDAFNS